VPCGRDPDYRQGFHFGDDTPIGDLGFVGAVESAGAYAELFVGNSAAADYRQSSQKTTHRCGPREHAMII